MTGTPCDVPDPKNMNENAMAKLLLRDIYIIARLKANEFSIMPQKCVCSLRCWIFQSPVFRTPSPPLGGRGEGVRGTLEGSSSKETLETPDSHVIDVAH